MLYGRHRGIRVALHPIIDFVVYRVQPGFIFCGTEARGGFQIQIWGSCHAVTYSTALHCTKGIEVHHLADTAGDHMQAGHDHGG